MKHDTIGNQTTSAGTAINNSLRYPEVKAAVLKYGYTVARLNEGRALLNEAIAAVEVTKSKASDKKSATADLKTAFGTAKVAYQSLAKVARAIFLKHPTHLTALGLDDAMPRRMNDFALAAQVLFGSGEYPDGVAEALAANGYGSSTLSQERAKIAEFVLALQTRAGMKGDAKEATKEQRKALKALHEWYAAYIKIAGVALQDKPNLLEKLGILKRVSKTKAQRSAPAKSAATRAKNTALKSGGTAKAA